MRIVKCPSCGRVTSVPDWVIRPICVHAWNGNAPEVWDGASGYIEQSPNESFRTPGPNTWMEMQEVTDEQSD